MAWDIKIKTGFYETTNFEFSISDDGIQLISVKAKEAIEIVYDDLISITLTKKKNFEIEIRTKNQIFTGTFTENLDSREIYQVFKKQINTKIIYEEE